MLLKTSSWWFEKLFLKIYYYPRNTLLKIIKTEVQDCHICQIYADKPGKDDDDDENE